MPNIIMLKTDQVILPYSSYSPSEADITKILDNTDMEIAIRIEGQVYACAIYCDNNTYASYGCISTLKLGFDKKNNLINSRFFFGENRVKVRFITRKPEVDEGIYQGAQYQYLIPPKGEIPNAKLEKEVLQLANHKKEELLKDFNHPELITGDFSYIIVDQLFPGKTQEENKMRLEYLAERSENRRSNMLKRFLRSKQ